MKFAARSSMSAGALADAPVNARFRPTWCPNPKFAHIVRQMRSSAPSQIKDIGMACSFSLYSQAKETRDDYYHDHHTDDVKDVHCALLRVRDAICLRDGKSVICALGVKRHWSDYSLIGQRTSV
jgi:hypothetical protein